MGREVEVLVVVVVVDCNEGAGEADLGIDTENKGDCCGACGICADDDPWFVGE
jgi:hypothetical protein